MKKWSFMVFIGILFLLVSACASEGSDQSGSQKPVNKEGKTIVTLSVQQASSFYETAEKKV